MSTHRRRPTQQRLTTFRIIRITLWHRRNLIFREACPLLGLKPLFKRFGSISRTDLAPMAFKAHIDELAILGRRPDFQNNVSNSPNARHSQRYSASRSGDGTVERTPLSAKSTTFRDVMPPRSMCTWATLPGTSKEKTYPESGADR